MAGRQAVIVKVMHLKNGDMIVSQGAKPVFVILGIMVFLFIAKDAFKWIFTGEHVHGSRFLAIAAIVVTVLIFYRAYSLSSKFLFSSAERNLQYSVQHTFFNKKGSVPVASIDKAAIETDSDGMSRIVIICNDEEIPMSSTVESSGNKNSVCVEINEWLDRNS